MRLGHERRTEATKASRRGAGRSSGGPLGGLLCGLLGLGFAFGCAPAKEAETAPREVAVASPEPAPGPDTREVAVAAPEPAPNCVPPAPATDQVTSLAVEVRPVSPWCERKARFEYRFVNRSNASVEIPVSGEPPRFAAPARLNFSGQPFGIAALPDVPATTRLAPGQTVSASEVWAQVGGPAKGARGGPWEMDLELELGTETVALPLHYSLQAAEPGCYAVCAPQP